MSRPSSITALIALLEKENISVVIRQNEEGIIYGLTYIDHKTKTVFNGSHWGKAYSANAIQQKCKPALTFHGRLPDPQHPSQEPLPAKDNQRKTTLASENNRQQTETKQPSLNIPNLNSSAKEIPTDNSVPIEPPKRKRKNASV